VLTADVVRADVAELLHLPPEEVLDSDNLFEFGLDSIRLATLLERWRDAGAEISFVDLAEQPTLAHWLPLLIDEGRSPSEEGVLHRVSGRGDEPRLTAA
jgi:bifunctional isochorismate lyase/aryl carrier protein